jgi:hypothetical protein
MAGNLLIWRGQLNRTNRHCQAGFNHEAGTGRRKRISNTDQHGQTADAILFFAGIINGEDDEPRPRGDWVHPELNDAWHTWQPVVITKRADVRISGVAGGGNFLDGRW